MALAQTTIRVATTLRDEISRLAERRGSTMQDVIAEAVHRLSRDEWWASVHSALDAPGEAETASYRAENRRLDAAAAADGLNERPGQIDDLSRREIDEKLRDALSL